MAKFCNNRGMNIETTVLQKLDAMEKDDSEIFGESENSDPDLLNDDDPTFATFNLDTHYSDIEARV